MNLPLKIAIDATPIRGQLSGIGFYTLNLIQALHPLQTAENFQLQVYFQPSVKHWLTGQWQADRRLSFIKNPCCLPLPVTLTTPLISFPNPLLGYLESRLKQPDIIHGTDHFVFPARHSLQVMTIHDLTFLKYPEFVPKIVTTYGDRLRACLKTTQAVITFAESTKQDLVQLLQIEPQKIYITPQASRYPHDYQAPQALPELETLKQQVNHSFQQPYFLFVGTLEPRKNLVNLITAFNLFKTHQPSDHQLILIGQLGWQYEAILNAQQASPFCQEIHHLHYLSNDQVAWFYQNAQAFIYPSFYEGFGLPVIEAMTLGCPVITSHRSSLPEVTGEAALLINPDRPQDITQAMTQISLQPSLRATLRQRGLARSQQFSWEKTAQMTLAVYQTLSKTNKN